LAQPQSGVAGVAGLALGHPPRHRLRTEDTSTKMLVMKKVFHFDAPREKYHCDAAIVWCGVSKSDPIKIAGGAKCLASPENQNEREFVLEQIRKSIRLHGTGLVILMVHSDCGGYGGLRGGFGGNAHAEAQHHEEELRRAAECLHKAIPGIDAQAYFVDFEGVWEVDLTTSQTFAQPFA
jgi:hypothetical protein